MYIQCIYWHTYSIGSHRRQHVGRTYVVMEAGLGEVLFGGDWRDHGVRVRSGHRSDLDSDTAGTLALPRIMNPIMYSCWHQQSLPGPDRLRLILLANDLISLSLSLQKLIAVLIIQYSYNYIWLHQSLRILHNINRSIRINIKIRVKLIIIIRKITTYFT